MNTASCQRKSLVVAALLAVLCSNAFSQRVPLACQVEAAGGLAWDKGRWVAGRFEVERFILVREGNSLTTDSVAKALRANSAKCEYVRSGRISCNDQTGGYMLFEPSQSRGVLAQVLGGTTDPAADRDSVYVAPFSCQAF
jgi:hypothetical protein